MDLNHFFYYVVCLLNRFYRKVLDEKVNKTKLCNSTQIELQKLHREYQLKNKELEEKTIKIKQLASERDGYKKQIPPLKKKLTTKISRIQSVYKSAFSAMRSELKFIKQSVQTELDLLQKGLQNITDNIVVRFQELLNRQVLAIN